MSHTKITREEVERIARLARLRFSDAELETFTADFDRIIAYVEKLDEVDCTGIEPMTRAQTDLRGPRADEVGEMLEPAEALKNAPEMTEGFFRVPKVMGESPE